MNINTKQLTRTAVIAAIYYVLTVLFQSVSYGPVQFRISEILNLLCFYNPYYAPGIVLGVFLSNLSSPLGYFDLIFGTLHTAIALFSMTKVKNMVVASLMPALFSFLIGFELMLAYGGGFPGFVSMTASVMLSEFIICTLISVPVYRILEKRESFRHYVVGDAYIHRIS